VKVAIVTPRMASGERGGAEALYRGLLDAFRAAGHHTHEVPVYTDESSFTAILESYARCYALDLSGYDLVVSTKAPTFMVSHPNHVSYLLHTLRVFYDMFESEYGHPGEERRSQRQAIHALDRFGLRPGRVRRHFANGHTTYRRLFDASPWWRTVGFRALHHPPALSGFTRPRAQDYILMPGRLHRWKRVHLIIEAYRHLKRNVPLLITGTGEDEPGLRALAAGDRRIKFLGAVGEARLVDLYADALLVPFVPRHEDYGLVTIEAFKSGKPVLTCTDSGETLEFVRDGENGYVVEPDPKAIAERLRHAIDHRPQAARLGARGLKSVSTIAWEPIVEALTGGARGRATTGVRPAGRRRLKVTVLDMQPIDPPLGGGRLRLLGLYHALGRQLPTTYVGTYDWAGERHRHHRLSETLEEIDVPLSDAHFAAAAEWQRRADGRTVIDVAFPHLAHHSAEYVETARQHAADADIAVFSHPWVYPLVKDVLRQRRQLVVYDAHNVEGLLRLRLLGDTEFGAQVAAHGAVIERELAQTADLVLVCSHEDRQLLHELYDLPFSKIVVVPNGTFTEPIAVADGVRRAEAKLELALPPGPMALFIASLYPPNVEAAQFVNDTLAPALPLVTFVICGGVGDALSTGAVAPNVRLTGVIEEERKRRYLKAADVAINPMFAGSGTNIKMFDFMAAGLPVVTTAVGARGIQSGVEDAFALASRDDFSAVVARLLDDQALAASLGMAGRRVVAERYSWERISRSLGRLLQRHRLALGKRPPAVSVIVPTYERQDVIGALMECLSRQTIRNFEVIVVDQSAAPWTPDPALPFDLLYVHTDVKGAGQARNTGAFYARGGVLAFTDDDCRPDADWLEAGLRYFEDPGVVGVEGVVVSDRAQDERFRPVTNVGFEGIGFMTANLMLRRETFVAIDGFDPQFDRPFHFREDTDLAWRALGHGAIPFGPDVRVYHPPQPRAVEREALASRVQFFENDALLFKKHPERYRTLFLREAHYERTPGFSQYLLRGAVRHRVQIDDFYLSRCARHQPLGS
jgi:glycosyltransferase involved in cell wall biosynthesis/GT2 family glycosyltransferase